MTTMPTSLLHVTINGTAHTLPSGATLADAISHIQAVPPAPFLRLLVWPTRRHLPTRTRCVAAVARRPAS